MVQKYQNEISPILYYGISTKTNEKDLKIPTLLPPNWKSPYWMTLYICVTCEQELLQHQPEQPLSRVVDVVLDTGFEERVAREREKILNK